MKTIEFKTAWGEVALTLDSNGRVVALNLPHLAETPRKAFAVLVGTAVPAVCGRLGDASLPSDFFQALEKIFPRIGIPEGTEFHRAVWNELKKIPRGQTRTYSAIAAAIGKPKAVRAVGSACGANPLPVFIPCHRVVAKNGLGGFGCGLPWKKLLLEMEGWNDGRMG